MTWRLGAALLCLLAVATSAPGQPVSGMRQQRAPVSDAIFPPQRIPLVFSHVRHLSGADIDCDDCHETAGESESSLDNLLPGEDACRMCHRIDRAVPEPELAPDKPTGRCVDCHPTYDHNSRIVERVRLPLPNLKFSHRSHMARGTGCRSCHGDLVAERVVMATRDQLPSMQTCLRCHDGRTASAECTTCHLSRTGGRIDTEFASGSLVPSGILRGDAHDMTFRSDHAAVAQNDAGYCESCHRKEFCVDCHGGVIKPMDFHGGDYISMHPIQARRNSPDCTACHRQQTFCVGCHSRTGVAADGKGSEYRPPSSGLEGRRFHPSGWVEFNPGLVTGEASRSATHHAFEAQRNIRQCASCHRESFCLTCHSAQSGSFRVNPHPRSWVGSGKCQALLARAGRMCLRCHVDLAEVDCDRPAR